MSVNYSTGRAQRRTTSVTRAPKPVIDILHVEGSGTEVAVPALVNRSGGAGVPQVAPEQRDSSTAPALELLLLMLMIPRTSVSPAGGTPLVEANRRPARGRRLGWPQSKSEKLPRLSRA